MTITINPCRACREKHGDDCNINTINDCVAETAAAFAGIPNNSVVEGTPSGANWYSCMSELMASQGREWTNLRLDPAPVFVQAPHYYPGLLVADGGYNKEASLRACLDRCKGSRYSEICKEHCVTDHNAVDSPATQPALCDPVPEGGVPQALPSLWDAANCDPQREGFVETYASPSPGRRSVKLSGGFWVGFLLVGVVLAFILALLIRTLYAPI